MSDAYEVVRADEDIETNLSDNASLQSIVEQRFSRRQTLMGGMTAVTAVIGASLPLAACGDENDLPTVTAGATGGARSGQVVTLTGAASDGDGSIIATQWTQTSGPSVTLNNGTTLTANFLAPSVAAATDLKFSFTATDNRGGVKTAETTVSITPSQLGFAAVAKSLADVVAIPAGYTQKTLYRLGDPLAAGVPAYANDGTDTNFAQRAGDHHDALYYYGLNAAGTARDDNSSVRGLLVMNHENITPAYLHPAGPTAPGGVRPEAEALKEIECHGVSVVEVMQTTAGWTYVQASTYNRRITPNTAVSFSGPARGNSLLSTVYSTAGTDGRGTINNCANGFSFWGTYLTCEENWAFYFKRGSADNAARTAKEVTSLNRYGITQGAAGNNSWTTVVPANPANTTFRRWDASVTGASAAADFRNEPNQLGWVVEFDPYDPASAPKKRTALGRFAHEGCWTSNATVGKKLAFYMGDDSRGEYFYKFVSAQSWVAADATATNRMAIGDKYLDAGTLYVAKFNADGTGTWLPLVFGTGNVTAANPAYAFADQADVLVNTRLAADAQGATKMDRPEWAAVNPVNGEVYLTLTNNNASRGTTYPTDAANPRNYNDPKGASAQNGNPNGHIIRIRETGDDPAAIGFAWDIYAFGAGADLDAANINLSGLDATNDFSSPDGLWFSRPTNAGGKVNPLLWIQTDDGAYTDVTNCMMLVAQPGVVNDGATKTITNRDSTTQATRIGAAPGTKLRRFMVGPKECELTGVDSTPDGRTLFVNIQHPGENGSAASPSSNWPAGTTGSRPRSATVVITKDDGGVVGL